MKGNNSVIRYVLGLVWALFLCLGMAAPASAQSSDKSELAKKLIVKVTGENNFGAGIIFSIKGDYIFIATANHVVRRGVKNIEFEFLRGVPLHAELIHSYDKLDLAVLRVDLHEKLLQEAYVTLPFDQINGVSDLDKGDAVYPVGHPEGEAWDIPITPSRIKKTIAEEIHFEPACFPGNSGGGLFDEQWHLIGMVIRARARSCEAISFERIRATLEDDWGLEVSRESFKFGPAEPVTTLAAPIKVWTEPVTGMDFVWVPAGCFDMGSPENEEERWSHEGPLHEVCVDGLWMGMTEVTNEQYRMWKTAHTSKEYEGNSLNDGNQPVVYVSWEDATDFAKWLTRQSMGPYEFRLPTEAEWEYACRAGTTTTRFWGDNPNDACHYADVADKTAKQQWTDWAIHDCQDEYAVTAPVGSFQPNAFGLHDMLGNVWEWCADNYDNSAYNQHQRNNPIYKTYEEDKLLQVLRGGAWDLAPRHVRCASRGRNVPRFSYSSVGFRLVRTEQ